VGEAPKDTVEKCISSPKKSSARISSDYLVALCDATDIFAAHRPGQNNLHRESRGFPGSRPVDPPPSLQMTLARACCPRMTSPTPPVGGNVLERAIV